MFILRYQYILVGILLLLNMRTTTIVYADDGNASDASRDGLSPRQIALGGFLYANATGYSSTSSNPSGLILNNRFIFESGVSYRESDDGFIPFISACDSTVVTSACVYYRYSSSALIRDPTKKIHDSINTHEFGAVVAQRLWNLISIGTTTRYSTHQRENSEDDDIDIDSIIFDVGMTFIGLPFFKVGIVKHNFFNKTNAYYPNAIGVGGALILGSVTATMDGRWNFELADADKHDHQDLEAFGMGLEALLPSGSNTSQTALRIGWFQDQCRPEGLDNLGNDHCYHAGYLSGGIGYDGQSFGMEFSTQHQLSGIGSRWQIIGSVRYFPLP